MCLSDDVEGLKTEIDRLDGDGLVCYDHFHSSDSYYNLAFDLQSYVAAYIEFVITLVTTISEEDEVIIQNGTIFLLLHLNQLLKIHYVLMIGC